MPQKCYVLPEKLATPVVIGRSVLSLSVRQEICKIVVSSCIPPESVSTTFALDINFRKSRSPKVLVELGVINNRIRVPYRSDRYAAQAAMRRSISSIRWR